jgi:hypothetical protein
LFFYEDFVDGAQEWSEEFKNAENKEQDLEEHFLDECYHENFSKIKFLKSVDTDRGYLDDYEEGLFRERILLEVIL